MSFEKQVMLRNNFKDSKSREANQSNFLYNSLKRAGLIEPKPTEQRKRITSVVVSREDRVKVPTLQFQKKVGTPLFSSGAKGIRGQTIETRCQRCTSVDSWQSGMNVED